MEETSAADSTPPGAVPDRAREVVPDQTKQTPLPGDAGYDQHVFQTALKIRNAAISDPGLSILDYIKQN